MRIALDKYREKLLNDVFLIPVMLDEVDIPAELRLLQAIRETDGDCLSSLKEAISAQLTRLGETVSKVQESHGLSWDFYEYKDAWEGLPGYDATCEIIRVYSRDYPQVEEIGHLIRGRLCHDIMAKRNVMFEQDSSLMNFGKGKYWRTNAYSAKCTNVSPVENVISIEYTVYVFNAGAVHGYPYFMTFSFVIHPTVYLEKLTDIFVDPKLAFRDLQAAIRTYLLDIDLRGGEDEKEPRRLGGVESGTENWDQFSSFTFSEEGLTIYFAPYAVGSFADGPQRAIVKWRTIRPYVRNHILCALGREFEHFSEKSESEQKEMRKSLGVKDDLSPALT